MDKILCARTILMYRYHDDMRAGGGGCNFRCDINGEDHEQI